MCLGGAHGGKAVGYVRCDAGSQDDVGSEVMDRVEITAWALEALRRDGESYVRPRYWVFVGWTSEPKRVSLGKADLWRLRAGPAYRRRFLEEAGHTTRAVRVRVTLNVVGAKA